MKFEEVIEALKTTYSRRILESYGYDNTRKKYHAIEAGEHNNGDKTPSMGVYNSRNGFYLKDFAGEQKLYSAIDVIMVLEGLSFADAVKRGAEMCGIEIEENERKQHEELSPDMKYIVSGLYRKAKQEDFSVKAITATHHYLYRDADGKKLYDKYRIDFLKDKGNKEKYIVQGIENNGFVRFKFKEGEYQSYIAMYGDFRQYEPGEKVYIVEGEKCVDACHSSGMKNTVTVGSSNDFRYKGKKFTPYFKGTDIVILQDNDQPGEKLTKEIIAALKEVANSIKVIVPDKSREKADIADFFQNGGTLQQLGEMEENTPVQNFSEPGSPKLNIGQGGGSDLMQFHFVNENGKIVGINHNAIAEDIKAKHSLFVSGCFYESDKGYYRADETGAKIKDYIKQRIVPDLRKSQSINQIFNLLHDDFEIERKFDNTNLFHARYVPFSDCLLDPLTWEEIPYKDEYYCVNRLPHNWKDCKNATEGTETEKYLHFAIPDEQDREMALEFDGLSCNRDTTSQKAMLYVGQGGSGKSIKLRLLQAILGKENYSNVGLFDLGKRFMPGLLLGKLANICSDLPIKALSDEANEALKLIVGEDMIFHETKGQNGFYFTPYCKMTFSTNMLPQVLDERNNAVFRRLLIVRMDNTPEHPDIKLYEKLERELPYYIRLIMEALHRLYERGYILESENSKNEIEQMRRDSDTTADFLDMCCTVEPKSRVDRGELFTRYEKHCEDEGRQSLSKNAFNKAMRAKGFKQVKSCGYWYFEGISLEKSSLNLPYSSEKSSLSGVRVDENGFMEVDEESLKDLPFTL